MKNFIRKQIFYLILSIIMVVAMSFAIIFFLNKINSKTHKVLEIKEKIVTYQKNERAFKDEVIKIKDLENRLEGLESKVISNENLPSLLSDLEKIAQNNKNEFEITSVTNPIVDEKKKLIIEFNTSGSYKDIKNFLEELKKQTFQINFSKISLLLQNSDEKTDDNQEGVNSQFWRAIATIEVLSF
ncbi:type 4a pilus biogenesis protein PilO [Candidatus Nomurabacteria bacterium]|nr:type 4a pilus biogenesis protein PilO [Candidatus Nomurabacteria bacterium]